MSEGRAHTGRKFELLALPTPQRKTALARAQTFQSRSTCMPLTQETSDFSYAMRCAAQCLWASVKNRELDTSRGSQKSAHAPTLTPIAPSMRKRYCQP
jgi:hypothetical protein